MTFPIILCNLYICDRICKKLPSPHIIHASTQSDVKLNLTTYTDAIALSFKMQSDTLAALFENFKQL